MRNAKGEGSAFKTATGYRGYVTINGRRKYFSAKTKTEALQKRRDLLAKGPSAFEKDPSVEAWLNHWHSIAKHRPKTAAANRWIIDRKIAPAIGGVKLGELTVEQIEQWLDGLNVSGSSQRRYLAPLKAALEVAVARRKIQSNPAKLVVLEPVKKPQTTSYSREDRDAILNAATGWNRARWHLGLRLGLRPGEVLGLTWPDFDPDNATLTVRNQLLYAKGAGVYLQAPKTDAGERVIELPPSLVAMLKEHRQEQLQVMGQPDWVGWEFDGQPVSLMFTQTNGRPILERMDRMNWYALLTAAGLPRDRRYIQRHTAATHMISESDGDVAVVSYNLGHRDSGFTYRTYVHPLAERKRALAEKMDEVTANP